jgi:ribosomal protein L32
MSLQVCADCGTAYLPADVCPHCGGGVFRFDWEEDMPKATVEGGGSVYSEGVPSEDAPAGDTQDAVKPAAKPRTPKAKAAAPAADDE